MVSPYATDYPYKGQYTTGVRFCLGLVVPLVDFFLYVLQNKIKKKKRCAIGVYQELGSTIPARYF